MLIIADPIRNQVFHEYHTRLQILYKFNVSYIFAQKIDFLKIELTQEQNQKLLYLEEMNNKQEVLDT